MTTVAIDAVTPNDPLSQVYFFGSRFKGDIRDQITESSFDAGIDQVTQIELNFMDPGFHLLSTGIFTPKIPVNYEDYRLEVSSISTDEQSGNEKITVKCRPRAVRLLKERVGRKVYKGVSPSDFVKRECKAVGISCVVQPSAKRKQIARDVKKSQKEYDNPPSSWTTFNRLANEIGFAIFEVANVIYFGKPTWLMAQTKSDPLPINWKIGPRDSWAHSTPQCSKSSDDKAVTVSATLPVKYAAAARVGRAALLSGVPDFDGYYLITNVTYDLQNASYIDVSASTPVDPTPAGWKKHAARKGSTTSGIAPLSSSGAGGSNRAGTKRAADFASIALAQAGDKYIFGVEVNLNDPNPSAFDCSELVQWAAAQAGVFIPDGSDNQRAYCKSISVDQAIATRGALLFKPGHVAISLGNGMTIEALNPSYGVREMSATNRSFSWSSGGLIPGMIY